jgi:hypothetical protein
MRSPLIQRTAAFWQACAQSPLTANPALRWINSELRANGVRCAVTKNIGRKFVTRITAAEERRLYPPRHGGSSID